MKGVNQGFPRFSRVARKRGKFTIGQILGLILAAIGVFLLATTMYQVIAPNFDRGEETSKSYYNTFVSQIERADGEDVGVFTMWDSEKDDKEFWLVYFGEKAFYGTGDRRFDSLGTHENHICICYFGEERDEVMPHCDYCKNLDYPVSLDGESKDSWAIGEGERVEITKGENEYEFKVTS